MESLSEGDDQFFDTRDEITSVSDSGSDCSDNPSSDLHVDISYEDWIRNPGSICERRNKFLHWMGLDVHQGSGDFSHYASCSSVEVEMDRVEEDSGAVLQSSSFDDAISSTRSSISCSSTDARELLNGAVDENFACRIRNLDNGAEFVLDEVRKDGEPSIIREVGSNRMLTVAEFEKSIGLSPIVQQVMRRGIGEATIPRVQRKVVKLGWLRRLGVAACVVDRQVGVDGFRFDSLHPSKVFRNQIVRVRSYKKQYKELSALYMRQDIPAHDGSILTMKFSPDGRFLASAGEDAVVRVWLIMESERSNEFQTFYTDLSHVYFMFNDQGELVSLNANKETKGRFKSELLTSDSTCVIFPQKVFQISEKPIYEYYGHGGEVLDLSWSTNKYLLSSSTDKTVRLWQVGCDQCRKVFLHNDYVTCVQFNPVDNNFFISGSIDGKIRIWEIAGCQVVDWIDIAEIVTAASYHPDGKGVVVGSITGDCRFYDATDNHLQLYAQICLRGKKKSASKRITGFQYCPHDPSKLLMTSADSKIRVLQGVDVFCKYEGFRNTGCPISASFTSDGTRIVSASEDSYVYVWNCVKQGRHASVVKKNLSCERFLSNNVSVAIPWCGISNGSSVALDSSKVLSSPDSLEQCIKRRVDELQLDLGGMTTEKSSSSPNHFSIGGFFGDSLPRGSATWPAETLPGSSLYVKSTMTKSQYKLLKASCQDIHGSPHAWGMVIVTAGWDGRIRSFQNYGLPVRT